MAHTALIWHCAPVERGGARQVGEALVAESRAERVVGAVELGVGLLQKQHPQLGPVGLPY
eukprot:2428507-Prymnesium_polylepis.1